MADKMSYEQAHKKALESFKKTFPELDDETAEKLMDAYIETKRVEKAQGN